MSPIFSRRRPGAPVPCDSRRSFASTFSNGFLPAICCVLAMAFAPTAAKAQIAHFSGAQSAVGSGLTNPFGVAVDGSGNVYIADYGNNRVLKETLQSDGSYTQSTIADATNNGLSGPYDVAVDSSGNVYIGDTYNSRVLKLQTAGVNFNSSNIGTATASIPLTFTFDTGGVMGGAPQVLTGGRSEQGFYRRRHRHMHGQRHRSCLCDRRHLRRAGVRFYSSFL